MRTGSKSGQIRGSAMLAVGNAAVTDTHQYVSAATGGCYQSDRGESTAE